MTDGKHLPSSLARLRGEFDRSFAEKPREAALVFEDFLAVRVGGDPYAIRLSEVAGLHRDRTIVPVTSRARHLLGVAGFRRATLPIYDLAAILGHSADPAARWLVLARASSVGFAFGTLEKHLRIEVGSDHDVEVDQAAKRFVHGAIRATEGTFSVIHLASVIEAITRDAKV